MGTTLGWAVSSGERVVSLFSFGSTEMIVCLVIGLVLFGGRLPEVGRSIGRSLIEFRKGLRGLKEEVGLDEVQGLGREIRDLGRVSLEDEEDVPDYYETELAREDAEQEDSEARDSEPGDEGEGSGPEPVKEPPTEETRQETAEDDDGGTGDGDGTDSPPRFGYES